MRAKFRIVTLAMGIGLAGTAAMAAPPQTTRLLQARFDQEPDVMRRAKLLTQMSKTDFETVSEEVAAGDNTDALKTLQQFLDDVQTCSNTLDAKERNPEEHPSGFKQLQIATRESLRRLDDIMVTLAGDEQAPFVTIRKNLDQLNRHLIQELFPHQPPPAVAPATPEQPQPGVNP